MATSKEYFSFISESLSGLDGVSYRKMMGEYILYSRGKVVGGIYDDRLMIKPTKSAVKLVENSGKDLAFAVPYPNAKEMYLADVDDIAFTVEMIIAVSNDV